MILPLWILRFLSSPYGRWVLIGGAAVAFIAVYLWRRDSRVAKEAVDRVMKVAVDRDRKAADNIRKRADQIAREHDGRTDEEIDEWLENHPSRR